VIDLQILVNQYIAEPSPAAKFVRHFRGKLASALENRERVAIRVRCGKGLVRNSLISEIQTRLDGQMKVALG
jgi:hypothetical protein